jgi:hypothetical protein
MKRGSVDKMKIEELKGARIFN